MKHEENLRQLLKENTALSPILQKAAASVARSIQFSDEHRIERLRYFLISPEVDAIVRQIYSSKLSMDKNGNHLESIYAEFMACLSLHLSEPEESLEDFGEQLFEALLKGCERALAIAIDKGILSAHEAKSAFRFRIILDELATINKNLAFLTAPHKPNVQNILEFEEKYRRQVAQRHGFIIPPHFDAARKLPIDELFVCPNFLTTPKKQGEELQVLKMQDFLSALYRAVLLGNPGGGKSTFVSKLCYDLTTKYPERLFAGRQVTPIPVILRDYGAEKKTRNCSILQFIEGIANSKYQVPPPPSAFEYLLLNGRVVVIFDGLDELLDTSYRHEISSDVESFCNLYPSVPVLVTSREVGYEQAPLDENSFEIFRLAPFDDDRVQDYVMKWFATDKDLTTSQQKQKASAFLEESRLVPDLRSNPLMLALMCNIYRGENYIPKNRPDVYEKCALMLFERWDKSRGIHTTLPFEAHIRPAMMYLANWIYTNETLQGGVTEKDLIAKATEYLCPRRFEDRDDAEKAAREFIEFCSGRAWVFSDTGTTKEGERLYQFTHRTFLEYFTAAHLVRTHPTPDKLEEILLPKIAKREWDVVAQLAFQLQNKNVEGAGDELLIDLIKQAYENEGDEGWNLLSFAARCLEFIVPSPKVIRDMTKTCIERCLDYGSKQMQFRKAPDLKFGYNGSIGPKELLGELLNPAIENRVTVTDSLEKLLIERINKDSEPKALLAVEIGQDLTLPLHFGRTNRRPEQELFDFWENVSDRIFDICFNRIETLCPKHCLTCIKAVRRRKIHIGDLIKWHGIECLFRSYSFTMYPGIYWAPYALFLINTVLMFPYSSEQPQDLKNEIQQLKDVVGILLSSPPPWIIEKRTIDLIQSPRSMFDENRFRNESPEEPLSIDSDALFSAFALFAAVLEASEERKNYPILIDDIKRYRIPFFNFMHWIFLARYEQAEADKVQSEMDKCGFTTEQQAFTWRWIRKEINLVQGVPTKDKKGREDLPDEEVDREES